MRLIKKINVIIIFSLLLFPNIVYSEVITPVQVDADYGTNHALMQRIGIKSDDSLWIIFHDSSDGRVNVAHSTDDGASWDQNSADTPFSGNPRYSPSLFVRSDDDILASATNPAVSDTPEYNIRNSSWGSVEAVYGSSNTSLSQVAADSSDISWCIFRFAPSGSYTSISANTRSGGSWGTKVDLALAGSYVAQCLSACMDDSDNFHAIWEAADANYSDVQTAYFDGNSWSSITSLDKYDQAESPTRPAINNLNGTIIATWTRTGLGTYTTKKQLRYATSTSPGSWSSSTTVTDRDSDMDYYTDVALEGDGDYMLVTASYDIDPNNTSVYHLCYMYYDGATWSSPEQLTEGTAYNRYPTIVVDSQTVHIEFRNEDNGLMYGTFGAPESIASGQVVVIRR